MSNNDNGSSAVTIGLEGVVKDLKRSRLSGKKILQLYAIEDGAHMDAGLAAGAEVGPAFDVAAFRAQREVDGVPFDPSALPDDYATNNGHSGLAKVATIALAVGTGIVAAACGGATSVGGNEVGFDPAPPTPTYVSIDGYDFKHVQSMVQFHDQWATHSAPGPDKVPYGTPNMTQAKVAAMHQVGEDGYLLITNQNGEFGVIAKANKLYHKDNEVLRKQIEADLIDPAGQSLWIFGGTYEGQIDHEHHSFRELVPNIQSLFQILVGEELETGKNIDHINPDTFKVKEVKGGDTYMPGGN